MAFSLGMRSLVLGFKGRCLGHRANEFLGFPTVFSTLLESVLRAIGLHLEQQASRRSLPKTLKGLASAS